MTRNRMGDLNKKDFKTICLLAGLFAIMILSRLGWNHAPESAMTLSEKTTKEIIIDLGEEKMVDHLSIFLGPLDHRKIGISSYNVEKKEWEMINDAAEVVSVFAWNDLAVNQSLRYLGIVAIDEEAVFNELVIVGQDGAIITPVNTNKYPQLFDEQALFVEQASYYEQTMFDEIYHARTGYEFLHGLPTYETTHPPLGKIFISIGIRLFGMNPFGWRIAGAVFGIMLIPIVYLFAKKLFENDFVATVTTLLVCFDFMPFVLSKIATIDIFIACFIMLMYYFMYQYCKQDLGQIPLKKSLVPLGLSGITMGLGIATKWTGVYAAAGLAILFFAKWYNTYKQYREQDKEVRELLLSKVIKTYSFCILTFVIIPVGIYVLSYIPVRSTTAYTGLIDKVIDQTKWIFSYHSQLTSTHPFESKWYEWPIMKRPLYEAAAQIDERRVRVISCFGNPAIWWPGILAVIYVFKSYLKDKDQKAGFLCIMYAAQLVPWCFISRSTFIYHYFPCALVTILCLGYSIQKYMTRHNKNKKVILGYLMVVVFMFIMFYPAISGMVIDRDYVKMFLEWFNTWVLC